MENTTDLSLHQELVMGIGEGNPGALNVCTRVNLPVLRKLEEVGIKGSDIWMLYKDECGENIHLFILAVELRYLISEKAHLKKENEDETSTKNHQ